MRLCAEAGTTAPDEVWRLWTTPSTWGEWDRGLTSARLEGPFVVGARGEIVDRSGRTSTFVVVEVEQGEHATYEVRLPAARLVLRRSLTGHRFRTTTPRGHLRRPARSGVGGGPGQGLPAAAPADPRRARHRGRATEAGLTGPRPAPVRYPGAAYGRQLSAQSVGADTPVAAALRVSGMRAVSRTPTSRRTALVPQAAA